MSNHLSEDQISRWILGQSSPEEEEHGRNCPTCSAELIQFREAVSTFQSVIKNWSDRKIVPRFETIPGAVSRQHGLQRPFWRLALVGAMVAVLAGIPVYQQHHAESAREPGSVPRSEAEVNEDVLLMEEVTMHLSRPLPMPMQRVIMLLPSEEALMIEQPNVPESEEIQ